MRRRRPIHGMGFEAFWVLAQAIENAQSVDPTVVKNAFEKMTKFETTTGPGKLGGAKTYGIEPHSNRAYPYRKDHEWKGRAYTIY